VTPSADRHEPEQAFFMHPLILISASVLVGILFALQEWMNAHRWGYRISVLFLIEMWGMQFLIWGAICWLMWRFLRPFIVQAKYRIAAYARASAQHRHQHSGGDDSGSCFFPGCRWIGHPWITGTG